MRVKIQQFLFGKNHSWSVCGKELARAALRRGHEVDLISTDGVVPQFVDKDLASYIQPAPRHPYDCQISYTAMKNFTAYLNGKNTFGIWNYEFDVLPSGMAKYANWVDKFLPSSQFFYDICLKNNIPKEKMAVVPHGVDWDRFAQAEPYPLPTDKKYKLLVNFGQPHERKNIAGTLDAFGKAFTKKDDICLVIKAVNKKPESAFEVDFSKILKQFKEKYPNHAEIVVLDKYIPQIERVYKSCDALFMLPNAEAFFFPALEMLASGGLVITSNYGGQLDFLNSSNAILVNGKMVRAPKSAQYWSVSSYASMFQPDVEEAADHLIKVYQNFESIKNEKLANVSPSLKEKFNWDTVFQQIENLCQA